MRFDIYKNVFDLSLLDPSTAADEVNARKGAKPILLADVQDNPGGGATSANTDVLHALVEAKCQSVLDYFMILNLQSVHTIKALMRPFPRLFAQVFQTP